MQGTVLVVFLNISVLIAAVLLLVYVIKRGLREQIAFKNWVESLGFTFIGGNPNDQPVKFLQGALTMPVELPYGMQMSSYSKGVALRGLSGGLPHVHNQFSIIHQLEQRGSGKNSRYYSRTVATVQIPDTRLHLIVNSKINNDAISGGNLTHYHKVQQHSLEGEFATYFDVYLPDKTQSESLSLLAPDSMLYIMTELADFDIEINGSFLFLYAYKHLKPPQLEALLVKLEKLLEEFRLRAADARRHAATQAEVSRSAASLDVTHRALRRSYRSVWKSVGTALLVVAALLIPSLGGYFLIINSGMGTSLSGVLFLLIGLAAVFGFIVYGVRQAIRRDHLRRQYFTNVHGKHEEGR